MPQPRIAVVGGGCRSSCFCYLSWYHQCVPKIRRGGFVFLAWKGDHSPHHVHVYRDGHLVVKWDLDSWLPMKGKANARILRLLKQLQKEGAL